MPFRAGQFAWSCSIRYRVPESGPLPGGVPAESSIPQRDRRRGPEGPLPTIGDTLASGPRNALVYCQASRPGGWRCHHRGRVDLIALNLPHDLPFIHIPRARRLRCSRCGSRDVGVMPDWPSPQEVQARRMSGGATPVRVLNGIAVPIGDEAAEGSDDPAPSR